MTSTSKKVTDKKTAISKIKPVEPEVVQEPLLPGYYYREFAGLTILFNDKDMGNLSKICIDGGNKYSFWERNKFGQAFLAYHKNKYIVAHKNVDDFVTPEPITTGPMLYWGTYGCKKLIIKVANWNCLKIDDRSLDILEEYYEKEAQDREAALKAERDGLAAEKIDFQREIKKIREENRREREEARIAREEARAAVARMEAQNKKTHKKLDNVQDELIDVKEELGVVNTRVDVLVKEVVPPNRHKDLEERVGFMKLNNPECGYDFKTYRVQKCNVGRSQDDIRREYPGAKLWLELSPNPNAVNCLNRLKELYRSGKKGKLVFSYNSIKLNNGTTETEFKKMIDDILAQPQEYGK